MDSMECKLEAPVVELGPITDLFAEGVDRVEILGENARLVFWRWKVEAGEWQRVALEWAIVRPLHSLRPPVEAWHNVRIIRPPGAGVSVQ